MTATIEDLFPELLLNIFSHYIQSEGHEKFSRNVVPVCERWWKLSTTPSLWKSVRIRNLNYALSLSDREILKITQNLAIAGDWNTNRILLDPNRLSAVLSNISGLKSLEISRYAIDANTMAIVAEHCPNLERLHMEYVCLANNEPITLEGLGPILTICGPKLKHLHLNCTVEDNEQLISEIAAKCTSLEVFEWRVDNSRFPIYEIMSGCPRLQKLILHSCQLITTGENNRCGFKNLVSFETYDCDFDGLDLCVLLRDSNNLEHLALRCSDNLIFSDVSKIPSNKVKYLKIWFHDNNDGNVVALEQAVEKWKHTLLHLKFWGWEQDITSVLKTYLDGNQCLRLKVLWIEEENDVDQSFFKTFLLKCQNLRELKFYGKPDMYREQIMKFLNLYMHYCK